MSIKHPKSYKQVAEDIVSSWSGIGGNYVLVAPPLTSPEFVFKKLCKVSFQEDCGLDPDNFAIAHLPQVSYSNSKQFVDRVLSSWNVNVEVEDDQIDELDILEDAVDILVEQGRTPVLLLPQFHKAIEKLSWSLGTRLREMEVNYGLCTVVELPVPLSRLRERWELRAEKETLICSDFGQGHSMILLTGYKRTEIEALSIASNINLIYLDKIIMWSGGLPALVIWLIREARNVKSLNDFEIAIRKGSVEQCQRFLEWLDAPDSDYYKYRLSVLWQGFESEEERTEVKAHDWKEIILNRDDQVSSASIGFACTNSIGLDYSQSLTLISNAVMKGSVEKVDALVSGLPEAYRTGASLKYILAIISIWRLSQGFNPDWLQIEMISKRSENQLGNDDSATAKEVCSQLRIWHNFAKGVNDFNRAKDKNEHHGWRLTDSLSGRISGKKDSPLAAVQLVLYRLFEAKKIKDSNVAFKSVLDIPEQILQIYCGRKLKIHVWEAQKFEDTVNDAIRDIWVEGDYRTPTLKSRLGFVHLLYIGWVSMSKFDASDRLFQEFTDIQYWRETYDDMRTQPSHSITFESDKRWQDYYSKCLRLADRLSITLTGKASKDALPKLDQYIETLTK